MNSVSEKEFLFLTSENLHLVGQEEKDIRAHKDVLDAWLLRNAQEDFGEFTKTLKNHEVSLTAWFWMASSEPFKNHLSKVNFPTSRDKPEELAEYFGLNLSSIRTIFRFCSQKDQSKEIPASFLLRLRYGLMNYAVKKLDQSLVDGAVTDQDLLNLVVEEVSDNPALLTILLEKMSPSLGVLHEALSKKNENRAVSFLEQEGSKIFLEHLKPGQRMTGKSLIRTLDIVAPLFDGDLRGQKIEWERLTENHFVAVANHLSKKMPPLEWEKVTPPLEAFKSFMPSRGGPTIHDSINSIVSFLNYPFEKDPEGSLKKNYLSKDLTLLGLSLLMQKNPSESNLNFLQIVLSEMPEDKIKAFKEVSFDFVPLDILVDRKYNFSRLLAVHSSGHEELPPEDKKRIEAKLEKITVWRSFLNKEALDTAEWFLRSVLGENPSNIKPLPLKCVDVDLQKKELKDILLGWQAKSSRDTLNQSLPNLEIKNAPPPKKM